MQFTTRLALRKPDGDPVTGDVLNVDDLNFNFDKLDGVLSFTPCTSGTRPPTPFQGQGIAESDTGKAYVRIGTNWIQLPTVNSAGTHVLLSGLELNLTRNAATDTILYGQAAADTVGRFLVRADGRIEMGPGNAGRDVNLYRRGANHLGTDDSFQAGGFCSGAATESVRTTNFPGITAETVVQSVTFDAVSGAGYMIYATQHYQSSVLNDIVRTRLRYAAGTTVNPGGTQLHMINPNCDVVNRGQPISFAKLFIAPSTGQFTVGVTMERVGTGTAQSYGEPTQAINTITVVGA